MSTHSLPSSSPMYGAPMQAEASERPAILSTYRALAPVIRTEIAGLTEAQLLAHPVPNTWSIHQIVLHLADSELVFSDRFKRTLADASPRLMPFDENRWMDHLAIPQRSAERAALLLELTRLDLSSLFDTLPTETLLKTALHEEIGPISLLGHLKRANWHLEHHLKFLREKRTLLTSNK